MTLAFINILFISTLLILIQVIFVKYKLIASYKKNVCFYEKISIFFCSFCFVPACMYIGICILKTSIKSKKFKSKINVVQNGVSISFNKKTMRFH